MARDLQRDAVARYELAVEIAQELRLKWEAEGRPTTTLGGATGRSTVEHPLLTLLLKWEKAASDLAKPARLARESEPGRKPVARVLSELPALKAVK